MINIASVPTSTIHATDENEKMESIDEETIEDKP